MMIAAIVCFVVALVALCVGTFLTKSKNLSMLFSIVSTICFVCLASVCAAKGGDFDGYAIFLIVSPLPLLLNLVELPKSEFPLGEKNDEEGEKSEGSENSEISENTENNGENGISKTESTSAKVETENLRASESFQSASITETNQQKQQKEEKFKSPFGKSWKFSDFENEIDATQTKFKTEKQQKREQLLTLLANGCGAFLCGVCVFFGSLYIGLESVIGALCGVAFGLAAAFLALALKKDRSLAGFLSALLPSLAIGLCAGGVICALLYSISLKSILFSIGAIFLAVHFATAKKKYSQIILCVAYIVLCFSLVV